jgi:hypothetical protein
MASGAAAPADDADGCRVRGDVVQCPNGSHDNLWRGVSEQCNQGLHCFGALNCHPARLLVAYALQRACGIGLYLLRLGLEQRDECCWAGLLHNEVNVLLFVAQVQHHVGSFCRCACGQWRREMRYDAFCGLWQNGYAIAFLPREDLEHLYFSDWCRS